MPHRTTTASDAPTPLRVAVVDDRDVVRRGLLDYFRQLKHVVPVSVGSGEELLRALATGVVVDVALVHMELQGLGGATTISLLKRAYPHLPVVALCDRVDDQLFQRAISAKAKSVLLVRASVEEVGRAVAVVHSGYFHVNDLLEHWLRQRGLHTLRHNATEEEVPKPTARELEALALRAAGHSEHAVAEKMQVKKSTVHTFMKKLYAKCRVHSVADAAYFALKKGWLPS